MSTNLLYHFAAFIKHVWLLLWLTPAGVITGTGLSSPKVSSSSLSWFDIQRFPPLAVPWLLPAAACDVTLCDTAVTPASVSPRRGLLTLRLGGQTNFCFFVCGKEEGKERGIC